MCFGAVSRSAHALCRHLSPQSTLKPLMLRVGQSRDSAMVAAFFDELRLLGFIEGQNLTIVAGDFGLRDEQRSALAAEIVKLAPDVIWNIGSTIRTRAL